MAGPKKQSLTAKVKSSLKKAAKGVLKHAKASLQKQVKKHVTKKNVKKAIRKYGPIIGKAIGGGKGAAMGAAVGKIFGSGGYKISSNSILHGSQIPSFDRGKHYTRIRHREYIGDISGTTSFALTSYPINPGLSGTFPWLSQIASSAFDEYQFKGLVFEFRTTSANSVGSTNTSLGSVIMATEYNSTLPNFLNKVAMENSEFSSSCAPMDNMLSLIECKKNQNVLNELYVRNFTVPSSQDQRLYDLGNFQVATTGMQGTNKIGELWASYDVILYKQKQGTSSNAVWTSHYTATTGISTSHYFGTSQTHNFGQTMTLGATTITFPNNMPLGNYMAQYSVVGTSTAVATVTVGLTTNCVAFDLIGGGGNYALDNNGATQVQYNITWYFTVTGSGPVITLSGGTLPATATSMDLVVTALQDNAS